MKKQQEFCFEIDGKFSFCFRTWRGNGKYFWKFHIESRWRSADWSNLIGFELCPIDFTDLDGRSIRYFFSSDQQISSAIKIDRCIRLISWPIDFFLCNAIALNWWFMSSKKSDVLLVLWSSDRTPRQLTQCFLPFVQIQNMTRKRRRRETEWIITVIDRWPALTLSLSIVLLWHASKRENVRSGSTPTGRFFFFSSLSLHFRCFSVVAFSWPMST